MCQVQVLLVYTITIYVLSFENCQTTCFAILINVQLYGNTDLHVIIYSRILLRLLTEC